MEAKERSVYTETTSRPESVDSTPETTDAIYL